MKELITNIDCANSSFLKPILSEIKNLRDVLSSEIQFVQKQLISLTQFVDQRVEFIERYRQYIVDLKKYTADIEQYRNTATTQIKAAADLYEHTIHHLINAITTSAQKSSVDPFLSPEQNADIPCAVTENGSDEIRLGTGVNLVWR